MYSIFNYYKCPYLYYYNFVLLYSHSLFVCIPASSYGCLTGRQLLKHQLLCIIMSCPSQSPSASRCCCRVSLTCIPPELGDASLSGVVAGCQCRQPSGQSSCPVPSATMSLTAAATSPSAWDAPTRYVRPAYTNCTAKPAPLIRHQSARTSTCCRSTAPCCSWLELRWVRKNEGIFVYWYEGKWEYHSETKLKILSSFCVSMSCVFGCAMMCAS